MDEILASLDDAVLEALRNRAPIEKSVQSEDWTQKFYDPDRNKYDWDDPEWVEQNKGPLGLMPIYLTQGYFMIVLRRDYKHMTTHPDGSSKRWHAKIDLGENGEVLGVYGRRSGRGGEEPNYVYAHRELLDCLYANGDVDHINGWGLDNRGKTSSEEPINLRLVSKRTNGHNTVRERVVHHGLFPGVEKTRLNKKGKQLYGGKVCKRLGKKVKTFRSKRMWLSPEPANLWYKNKLKELNGGRETWAHSPKTVSFPVFPPLMESEPSVRSSALRARVQARAIADVPF